MKKRVEISYNKIKCSNSVQEDWVDRNTYRIEPGDMPTDGSESFVMMPMNYSNQPHRVTIMEDGSGQFEHCRSIGD